ncbi:MAG: ring-cleaving dioxygenase [Burkholderiales bacterium]|nr:ring-cleaving dioxygenase [Phycisphaerae bacterium]
MQLTGIHHLTAVTANAAENFAFYTRTLGMRLVKKTVNQDDVSAYHLFYADGLGSPGTDLTFFDWPSRPARRGGGSIVRTGLRVDAQSLDYWLKRFDLLGVAHGAITEMDGRASIDFQDGEGQRLRLVADDNQHASHPWDKSPLPAEHQIRGLGPITISLSDLTKTEFLLTELMGMRRVREYQAAATDGSDARSAFHVFEMGTGGPAAELHVAVEPKLPRGVAGAGGVHHVAFRVPTFAEYDQWAKRLQDFNIPSSGPIDRFYFRSLYFREPNGVLFELATDGPGFHADEPIDQLGQTLALPPFLEGRRKEIEAGLKPLETVA